MIQTMCQKYVFVEVNDCASINFLEGERRGVGEGVD
jgi:hypothetical protein